MKKLSATLLSLVMLATMLSSIIGFTLSANAVGSGSNDYIHAVGSKFYDMYGNEVRLTGANWFGFNCSERVLHGLWQADLRRTLKALADRGINFLRIPVSTELLYEWKTGNAKSVNIQVNPWGDINGELEGMNSMQIFDRMVEICKEYGIKIMVDVHSPDANNSGHNYELWYGKEMSNGVMCTTDIWIDTWVWLVEKFKNDDTIIACDLENEPHGQPGSTIAKWDGSTDENNWRYAAERCANAILDVNPNLLIMVEGIEAFPKAGKTYASSNKNDYDFAWWGGSLKGVRNYPVTVKPEYQSQIVYSPHDYGPKVFKQPWFNKDFTKETLMKDYWYDTWAYLVEENIAPLLIGEWGGFMDGEKNEKWMQIMADYIVEKGLSHTFWCVNANSGDTGGLLTNDWVTWEEDKYTLFKPTLWQTEDGKFIGLDHDIVLGDNGILIGDYYKNNNPDTETDTDIASDSDIASDTDIVSDTDIISDTDTEKDNNYILGDVNLDKALDIIDVVLTRSHIIGNSDLKDLDPTSPYLADMNSDFEIDIIDVVMMRSAIVNK